MNATKAVNLSVYIGKRFKVPYTEGVISKEFDLEDAVIVYGDSDSIVVKTVSGKKYFHQFNSSDLQCIDSKLAEWLIL